jgi:ABC-2 type transport system ATP-binding protein
VNTDAIREAMLELRDQGATLILSTHDMEVAERLCDFILMIFKGRKVLDGTLASVQDRFGSDVLRIRTADGPGGVPLVDGVEQVTDFGQFQELRLRRGQDPQDVLAALLRRVRLKSFEVASPTLHDIFVRVVRTDGKEADLA